MNSTVKRIIFISNSIIPQKDTSGGSIVIYRHLKRLKDAGHLVVVIYLNSHDLGDDKNEFEFLVVKKGKWYPPLRKKTPFLTRIRTSLTLNNLNKKFKFNDNDLVLGILGEVSNLLLLKIKQRFSIPFYLFFHDDFIFNRYAKENLLTADDIKRITKHVDHIFPVSDQLKTLLIERGIDQVTRLYPIPEGCAKSPVASRAGNDQQLNLLTAGVIGPVHFDILKTIGRASNNAGSRFFCVADLPLHLRPELTKDSYITYQQRFQTTAQLFDFIIENIDVLVIFYSFDFKQELRLLTSFPSKLVEYSHLGLPLMIVAPPQSTLGIWALQNSWLCYVDTDSQQAIEKMINQLKDKDYWEACRQQSLKFAEAEFNPVLIHEQFTSHLPV